MTRLFRTVDKTKIMTSNVITIALTMTMAMTTMAILVIMGMTWTVRTSDDYI